MLNRLIALFLVLFCLSAPALAETAAERLAQLDIIEQGDERIQEYEYYYYGQPFRAAGCLPSSATNVLVALLGDAETDTAKLVMEVLNATRDESQSPTVELAYLYYAARSPSKSATELQKLVAPVTTFYSYESTVATITPAQFVSAYNNDDAAHPLLFTQLYPHKSWGWLAELAAYLCENGHPDARIAMCSVSVGTLITDAPLRCSDYGHYVALYLEAEEFHENGTIYLMDSYPRALEGEAYGTDTPYDIPYPFISETGSPFYLHYTPTRVSDTVVQFSLRADKLAQLHALDSSPSARYELQQQFAETLTTFGRSYLIVYLP